MESLATSSDNNEEANLPTADGEGLYTRGGVVQSFDTEQRAELGGRRER